MCSDGKVLYICIGGHIKRWELGRTAQRIGDDVFSSHGGGNGPSAAKKGVQTSASDECNSWLNSIVPTMVDAVTCGKLNAAQRKR